MIGEEVKKAYVEEKKITLGFDKMHILQYQSMSLIPSFFSKFTLWSEFTGV